MKKESNIPVLIAEIKDEMAKLRWLKEKLERLPKIDSQKEEMVESAALKLHNFYTGCERIFQLIAREVNGGLPEGYDWHKRLLAQMSLDIEGIRPAVISQQTSRDLEELLAFRHIVRSIYGYELDAERVDLLVKKAVSLSPTLEMEIEKFCDSLQQLYDHL